MRLFFAVLSCALLWGCGFHTVDPHGQQLELPDEGFDWSPWSDLLSAHVSDNGLVDWSALAADDEALRDIAETLATVGPETTPNRFPTDDDELAYFINAYNILTALGVVHHWPIASVHDVSHPMIPRRGFGFFYAQRFVLDGREVSLYELENAILIDQYEDARIHAAINCASASCPRLRPTAFTGAQLNAQLDAASREFASQRPHVVVHRESRTIRLSMIYRWYADDFERDARALGGRGDVLAWIMHVADDEMADSIHRAIDESWSIEWTEYDWSLNGG
jgi:hypothetical protein